MSRIAIDILKEKLGKLQKNRNRIAQDRDVNQRMLDSTNAALDLIDADIYDLKVALKELGAVIDDAV